MLITQPVALDGYALDGAGREKLEKLLGAGPGNDAAVPLLDHVARLGGCYAIVEHPYTDQDYSSDYVTFYASAFKIYPRRTTRVHFFSRDVSEIIRSEIADQVAALRQEQSYLGFTVVRPIRQAPIGRTILKFPVLGDGLTVRYAARATFRVHLLGAELDVEGAPFIQQDARVGACAQAAIWMACRPLHERHRRPGWHAVSDITRIATTPTDTELSGALPHGSKGLSPIHIVRALRGMGHQPYCATFVDDGADEPYDEPGESVNDVEGADGDATADTPEDLTAESELDDARDIAPSVATAVPTIVRYLDSGLPVILGLANVNDDRRNGHAVTAVGYVEAEKAVREGDSYDCFVRALIVHDDQRGPYRLMALTDDDVLSLPQEQLLRIGEPIVAERDVTHLFVPLSPRVVRLADHADLIARGFVAKLSGYNDKLAAALKMLPNDAIDTLQAVLDLAHERKLVNRTYLTTAARYRRHMASTSLPEDVKIRAINRELPHFVWVVELISPTAAPSAPGEARPIEGHVIVNATSAIENETDLLFAHLPFLDFQRDVNPDQCGVDYVDHFTAVTLHQPYEQRVRR